MSASPGRAGLGRAGGGRLTGTGAVVVFLGLAGALTPPEVADRQALVLVWTALVVSLVVGIVWPLVAVRRISVTAVSPRDARVGERVPLTVTPVGSPGPAHLRVLDPTGGWRSVASGGTGTIDHLAEHRGVFDQVRIEVRVTAPLGMFAAHRIASVDLARPIEVAPQALAVEWHPGEVRADGLDPAAGGAARGGDLVRSVRPYVGGDPAHLVHWPSTAHAGELVIRELETPVPSGQVIVVDLRGLGTETERAASYAMGAARAVLANGGHLILCTAEPSGPTVTSVANEHEAGRRLARAVAGVPGSPPEGWPVVEIGR